MYFDSCATGKRIQHLRKANGMTQEEMAVKLNTSDRHLRNLERGEEASSIDLMVVSEKPILTFTIDFETVKRYRKANKMPHQFRRAARTDLTVEVCL
ncbi:MAG: helix-turn-helix domain-containing protein [Faecalibacterium prausnitzii]|nr:helix-turn-helix domain-containing protein [Faecalibacterium prausnitzii]